MMRFTRTSLAMLAALAIVAIVSQSSLAQPGQGRGGRGGFGRPVTPVQLVATQDSVQKALKVTDEQKEKIGKINDQVREDMRKAFEEGNAREKFQEINASASSKLNEVLDEGQQKRLMGILIQVVEANAVFEPAVGKELNITDDQKKKLDEVRQSNMDAMREVFAGSRDQQGSREEMRAKMDKVREEGNKKLMAELTTDQQKQLESLKGEKVEIDMAQLRGPGGPGGQRGGFGDRPRGERGNRGRGDRNAESKSEEKSSN
jgi:Spy/CpxP family protein refolding chaperone